VFNLPAGLGEPWFDSLEGELAKAIYAVPAVKGVDFGSGFGAASEKGSRNNDAFRFQNGKVVTDSNNAGGILGGISDGMPLTLRVAIKPTPSISQKQQTVDLETKNNTELEVRGRHDVCIVPRAVIVVESAMAITLCDLALRAGLISRILK
jgi:chorismate synthase